MSSDRILQEPVFATTHWSAVLQAGRPDSPETARALAELCRVYWYPLYAYVRRQGFDVPTAQDLTQDFSQNCWRRITSASPIASAASSAGSCSRLLVQLRAAALRPGRRELGHQSWHPGLRRPAQAFNDAATNATLRYFLINPSNPASS